MSSCRTGRETTMSELSLEEVVITICGRKRSEESLVALCNLPAMESPHVHKQQRQTLLRLHQWHKQNTFHVPQSYCISSFGKQAHMRNDQINKIV